MGVREATVTCHVHARVHPYTCHQNDMSRPAREFQKTRNEFLGKYMHQENGYTPIVGTKWWQDSGHLCQGDLTGVHKNCCEQGTVAHTCTSTSPEEERTDASFTSVPELGWSPGPRAAAEALSR